MTMSTMMTTETVATTVWTMIRMTATTTMPVPEILVVAPPAIQAPKGPIAPKFAGGEVKCVGLAAAFHEVCAEVGCHFFDAGSVTPASRVDGVHLDLDQQLALGDAFAAVVGPLLAQQEA